MVRLIGGDFHLKCFLLYIDDDDTKLTRCTKRFVGLSSFIRACCANDEDSYRIPAKMLH